MSKNGKSEPTTKTVIEKVKNAIRRNPNGGSIELDEIFGNAAALNELLLKISMKFPDYRFGTKEEEKKLYYNYRDLI